MVIKRVLKFSVGFIFLGLLLGVAFGQSTTVSATITTTAGDCTTQDFYSFDGTTMDGTNVTGFASPGSTGFLELDGY